MAYMNSISKYSKLLNKPEVQKIVILMLAGYIPESIKPQSNNEIVCRFIKDKSPRITLTIQNNNLVFEKYSENRKEITQIIDVPSNKNYPMINKFICEKRENGIVITEIMEFYDWTKYTEEEKLPVDLYEYRYVFDKNNIKAMYDNITPVQFELINKNNINLINYNLANLRTDFEVHMKTYMKNLEGYVFSDTMYPVIAKFNGDDVSYYYDMVDGQDKIERVHDLYNGIINGDNKGDIKVMHLGLMTTDGFDLRTFKGITDKENSILGNPLEPTEEYKCATRRILKNFIGYSGEINYDRDSLLSCICDSSNEIESNVEEKQKKLGLIRKLFPFRKK